MAIGICTPMVTVEDIVNGVKDEYGCRHAGDGKYLLKGCEGITSYTIKAGTEIIWDNAFYYFCLLEAVVIPDSVTMICREAFWGCRSLRDVVIPESVTLIGDNAFRDCTSQYFLHFIYSKILLHYKGSEGCRNYGIRV